ncbi:MAG TPA: YhbY family RNA-binding protein, partial [Xylella taiwanensis]
TSAFLAELNDALERHELVKVKVVNEDREIRDMLIAKLAAQSDSVLVQRIGHIAILYRCSKEKRQIVLPRA